MSTPSFQLNSDPSAARMPELAIDSGIAPSSTPCGQKVLAEIRVAYPCVPLHERGQEEHHHEQYGVFQKGQGLQFLCGELFRRYLMAEDPEASRRGTEIRR